jgi:hypothetical protein
LLVGKAIGEQVPGIVQQLTADAVPFGLEGDLLHVAVSAMGAIVAQLGEPETAQLVSETQMPQGGLTAVMDVHLPAAIRAEAVLFISLELSMQQVQLPVGCSCNDFCLVIVEVFQ